jgi:hypothetical protein
MGKSSGGVHCQRHPRLPVLRTTIRARHMERSPRLPYHPRRRKNWCSQSQRRVRQRLLAGAVGSSQQIRKEIFTNNLDRWRNGKLVRRCPYPAGAPTQKPRPDTRKSDLQGSDQRRRARNSRLHRPRDGRLHPTPTRELTCGTRQPARDDGVNRGLAQLGVKDGPTNRSN